VRAGLSKLELIKAGILVEYQKLVEYQDYTRIEVYPILSRLVLLLFEDYGLDTYPFISIGTCFRRFFLKQSFTDNLIPSLTLLHEKVSSQARK
jgi:hypothetical protein